MVEELRQRFERAEQQPENVQHRLAELLRLELEEEEADEYIPTPEELAAIEASDAEYATGQFRTFEEYDRERTARECQ